MKNHINVNGKLLQTNKTWNQLKEKQKSWIIEILRKEYLNFLIKENREPSKMEKMEIIDKVYLLIEEKEIWIPHKEVKNKFYSKINKFNKSLDKQISINNI